MAQTIAVGAGSAWNPGGHRSDLGGLRLLPAWTVQRSIDSGVTAHIQYPGQHLPAVYDDHAAGADGWRVARLRLWQLPDLGNVRGGQDAGATSLSLVVQGNTSAPVYIFGIRADVLSRNGPSKGVVVYCPTAGFVTQRPVAIDLDTSVDGRSLTKAPNSPFGFTVSDSDLGVFSITATTTQCDCKWVLQVEAVVNGQAKQFTVTDHGQPFETSAYNTSAVECEWNFSNAWDVIRGQRQIAQLPSGSQLTTSPSP